MWKAIWWALVGIPLGFVFGGIAGVVAATVITAAAGAVNWRWHMCEPHQGKISVRAYATGAAAAGTVVVVHALLPYLLPVAAVLAVLAVACVPVTRWVARRTMIPRSSAAYERQPHVIRARARAAARQRRAVRPAITVGPRAIEAPKPAVASVVLSPSEWERITS